MFQRLSAVTMALAGVALLAIGAVGGASFAALTPGKAEAQSANSARYWDQLTALMEPVQMRLMTDHRAFMLPSGVVMALHFDNLDLSRAQNLNWLALGIPGRFCASDQQRVDGAYGPGFTHFHDMVNDIHGGAPDAEGVWFVHSAVRDFDSPMSGGPITRGVDMKFMPTAATDC